jgi:hypothetical protein
MLELEENFTSLISLNYIPLPGRFTETDEE